MTMVADVVYDWKVSFQGSRSAFPAFRDARRGTISDSDLVVFIPAKNSNPQALKAWVEENTTYPHYVFARFSWIKHEFITERVHEGLTFVFTNLSDATYFRLAW